MSLIAVPASTSSNDVLNDADGMSTPSSAAPMGPFITPLYIIPKKPAMANLPEDEIKEVKVEFVGFA